MSCSWIGHILSSDYCYHHYPFLTDAKGREVCPCGWISSQEPEPVQWYTLTDLSDRRVEQMMNDGVGDDIIRQQLREEGVSESDIQQAFQAWARRARSSSRSFAHTSAVRRRNVEEYEPFPMQPSAGRQSRTYSCDGLCEPMCAHCNQLADDAADEQLLRQGY